MRDELLDDQRARLCVLELLIDGTTVDVGAFDLLRFAHWVVTGENPDTKPEDLVKYQPEDLVKYQTTIHNPPVLASSPPWSSAVK